MFSSKAVKPHQRDAPKSRTGMEITAGAQHKSNKTVVALPEVQPSPSPGDAASPSSSSKKAGGGNMASLSPLNVLKQLNKGKPTRTVTPVTANPLRSGGASASQGAAPSGVASGVSAPQHGGFTPLDEDDGFIIVAPKKEHTNKADVRRDAVGGSPSSSNKGPKAASGTRGSPSYITPERRTSSPNTMLDRSGPMGAKQTENTVQPRSKAKQPKPKEMGKKAAPAQLEIDPEFSHTGWVDSQTSPPSEGRTPKRGDSNTPTNGDRARSTERSQGDATSTPKSAGKKVTGAFRLDALEQQNQEMKATLELQAKKLANVEAQLIQTKKTLKTTTEQYRKVQQKNEALTFKQREEEEAERKRKLLADELADPLKNFDAGDSPRQSEGGGDRNYDGESFEDRERRSLKQEALKLEQDAMLERDLNFVRRAMGYNDAIAYEKAIEGRNFTNLRHLFIMGMEKLALLIESRATPIYVTKPKQTDEGDNSAKNTQSEKDRIREKDAYENYLSKLKRENAETLKQLHEAKKQAIEISATVARMVLTTHQLAHKGLTAIHGIVYLAAAVKDVLLQKSGKHTLPELHTVIQHKALDQTTTNLLNEVQPLTIKMAEFVKLFPKGSGVAWDSLDHKVEAVRTAISYERSKPLKNLDDEQLTLILYMEEVHAYRERLRDAQRRAVNVAIQTEKSVKDVKLENAVRAMDLAMRGATDGEEDEYLTPQGTPQEEMLSPPVRVASGSRPTTTAETHVVGTKMHPLMSSVIQATCMISAVCLQVIFGPAVAHSQGSRFAKPGGDFLNAPSVNLAAVREEILSGVLFPLSLAAEEAPILKQNRKEILLLLDVCNLWANALPKCHIKHCSPFIALIRRSPVLALDRFHNDRTLLAQQVAESTGGKFSDFLGQILSAYGKRAGKNMPVPQHTMHTHTGGHSTAPVQSLKQQNEALRDFQGLSNALRQMVRAKKGEALLNWKGLLRLNALLENKQLVREGIKELREATGVHASGVSEDTLDSVQRQRWRDRRSHSKMTKESLWGDVMSQLYKHEAEVRASGVDLELLDHMGPPCAQLMHETLESFVDRSGSEQVRGVWKTAGVSPLRGGTGGRGGSPPSPSQRPTTGGLNPLGNGRVDNAHDGSTMRPSTAGGGKAHTPMQEKVIFSPFTQASADSTAYNQGGGTTTPQRLGASADAPMSPLGVLHPGSSPAVNRLENTSPAYVQAQAVGAATPPLSKQVRKALQAEAWKDRKLQQQSEVFKALKFGDFAEFT